MPELYLIAHKVRGEAAFDVAHKLQIGSEEGWIIPTSGHRAYPYWQEPLSNLAWFLDSYGSATNFFEDCATWMPASLRDHYAIREEPKLGKPSKPSAPILSLDDLGL